MNNYKYILLCLLAFSLSLYSCKKDKEQTKDGDTNKISTVVADNFNLSIFNTGLIRSGLKARLLEPGPFTAITPSDAAFAVAGFKTAADVLGAEPARVSAVMNYHILDGKYELNKLPFLFNQEIRSGNGGKLFVTHWVKGADTVLTINGSKVISQNIKASNGLIQVIDQMLEPYTHELIIDAIASDRNVSLFYQALQRSGVIETLKGKGPYTIFAPDNAAMTTFGLPSLEAINQMDPAVLATVVRYHILSDRRFIYDYVLNTGSSMLTQQTMLDGNSVQIKLIDVYSAQGTSKSISLKGTGNTTEVQLEPAKKDVLTGNGVLHTIKSVLKITQ
ncbi:putative surface protein with fasciclin (FAS1) repeats [Pedobacter cryoconitis]|uniref:fasciclin domain-containing protein n=1 Tax=Pedobacter cryoconitis TaxID=188932 RepID=UPI00161638CE|nr:fasciclin domain-containing protein [Pedobacter cryoconitis]MBB6272947.1 putative surface protein with fasciclin (FAS1) repeats [Pedobacter cryoconitis]